MRNKLQVTASVLLLVALGFLLKPQGASSSSSPDPGNQPRPATRTPRPSLPPSRTRDFRAIAERAAKSDFPKLTGEELEAYLDAHHRGAGSLLAAFRISGDEDFLREAMGKYPTDPQVLLASLRIGGDPASRLEILKSLELADPENRLADCLSARILFDLGKEDEALAALSRSAGKPFHDYSLLATQDVEEAYLTAGFSPVEAKTASLYQSTKTSLMQMLGVADGLKKLRENSRSAGDDATVQASMDIQFEMARQIGRGGFLVDELVAMGVEKRALEEIGSPEARARIVEIEQEKHAMQADAQRIATRMGDSSIPESEWLLYFDRTKLFGEKAANQWMLEKYPDP